MPRSRTERQEFLEIVVADTVSAQGSAYTTVGATMERMREDAAGVFIGGKTPFALFWDGMSRVAQTRFRYEAERMVSVERYKRSRKG